MPSKATRVMSRPVPRPRSNEPRRRDLELKLLADTKAKTQRPVQVAQRLGRLFSPSNNTFNFANDNARMKDDFARRRGVREVLDLRISSGINTHADLVLLRSATSENPSTWAKCEDEDRGEIIRQLENLVLEKEPSKHILPLCIGDDFLCWRSFC